MAQILSQEEIDSLLTAVASGEVEAEGTEARAGRRRRAVQSYDFRRPNRISKDQVRTLQVIHDGFGKVVGSSLSAYLRTMVDVRVTSLEQITYGEFIRSLPTPSSLSIFEMPPLKGEAAVTMSPQVVFPMIDRTLGGPGRSGLYTRDFTEIERSIIERMVERTLVDLGQAWLHLGSFNPKLRSVETNPQFVQIVGPSEVVLLISFAMKVSDALGSLGICFPFSMLEPIVAKLTETRSFAVAQRDPSRHSARAVEAELRRTRVPVRAFLGEILLTMRELAGLKVGDVLRLDASPGSLAVLQVGDVPMFLGKPGLVNKRRAVQVYGSIQKGEMPHAAA
jgi:flagellar motor switch protein FliM